MKILYRYVLVSHLGSLGLTLGVFTFVLLLGNTFKDIIDLLANQSFGFLKLAKLLLLMIPYIFSFSMPMALLAATLLVMGRISADNELTASRACGVSFFELILPILGVAAALSFLALFINCSVAPRTKYLFNKALVDLVLNEPMALLEEGQYIRDFSDMALWIDKRDVRNKSLKGIRITRMQNNDMTEEIYAERGTVQPGINKLKPEIKLFNVRIDRRDPADPNNLQKNQWGILMAEYTYPLDMTECVEKYKHRLKEEVHHLGLIRLLKRILELKSGGIHPTPELVELHKRIALSVACLAFVLVALPLGVQVQRRETSVGVLMSLILAVLYYFFILFAESFKQNPHFYPELIIWIPNFIFESIGLFLLWKQSKI